MTDTRKLLLEDQTLLAQPSEQRRYQVFRRQFAAELYANMLGAPFTPLMSALLTLSKSDRPALASRCEPAKPDPTISD